MHNVKNGYICISYEKNRSTRTDIPGIARTAPGAGIFLPGTQPGRTVQPQRHRHGRRCRRQCLDRDGPRPEQIQRQQLRGLLSGRGRAAGRFHQRAVLRRRREALGRHRIRHQPHPGRQARPGLPRQHDPRKPGRGLGCGTPYLFHTRGTLHGRQGIGSRASCIPRPPSAVQHLHRHTGPAYLGPQYQFVIYHRPGRRIPRAARIQYPRQADTRPARAPGRRSVHLHRQGHTLL